MQILKYLCFSLCACLVSSQSWASELNTIEQTQLSNQQREQGFIDALQLQQDALKQQQQALTHAQNQQQELKQQFSDNEQALTKQYQQLQQRSGQLGQVLEVVKLKAQESQQTIASSILSAQYPESVLQLAFAEQAALPSATNIQDLAAALLNNLQQSSTISFFDAKVIDKQGDRQTLPLMRIGSFNIISEQGEYVEWLAANQLLQLYATQPSETSAAEAFFKGQQTRLLIDPSRGQLLSLLDLEPSLKQRVQQGGAVAIVIIFVAVLGLVVALYRIARLLHIERAVRQQLKASTPSDSNPLGRVLLSAQHAHQSLEELELRVDEAILNELPQLERGQSLVKLFAGIAPLLGLLGTVIGMIATFQSISLFGNGDPKLLASGISQALVTTVLGLVAAIPLLFCSSLMSSRSRVLLQLLQQKSLAMLADQQYQSASKPEAKA
ncbi:MotA/TolQ/ExbB proton channel family protein [Agarivorans sp. 1_MG-2023]|uniref:MotA/TolQ/ExbB proton channel family protein n=1 Tax=Agarivorans sp. 1_MG-2023 TaxID=3062634 RepID=UPI0026E1FEA7|nr:MotA/TolQ/ExbB proton channel family protein [Agarivorans sp. 1_MG-2023]MDO6763680.1 MotA/TolQ/ExbB proton channel family protein [Agarivorans sp. 1_MG-2023]